MLQEGMHVKCEIHKGKIRKGLVIMWTLCYEMWIENCKKMNMKSEKGMKWKARNAKW